ncbi:MAG: hypothetical protein FJY65_11245 [Calditrichaeota bacterium]|nr:hypothetical protein [Calditrichota bacterium]
MHRFNQLITAVAVIILLLFVTSHTAFALPVWSDQGDWDPLTVEGIWAPPINIEGINWYGPVVADLDNDGIREFIIADDQTIRIFDINGDEIELDNPIEVPNGLWSVDGNGIPNGYCIRGVPAIGDVTGDGLPEIVYTIGMVAAQDTQYTTIAQHIPGVCQHEVYVTCARTALYVCDGQTGEVLAQTGLIGKDYGVIGAVRNWIRAWTPVLADVDVINYQESNSFEDGRMDIILSGWSNHSTTQQIQGHEWYVPTGEQWVTLVIVYDESEQQHLQLRDAVMDGYSNHTPAFNPDNYLVPAVGDMNDDGKKEIISSSRDFIWIRTYNPATQTLSEVEQITRPNWPNGGSFFCGLGPTLADLQNNGTLRAIIPYNNGQATVIYAYDIDGSSFGNWNANNPFTGTMSLNLRELISVADIEGGGNPALMFHTTGEVFDRMFLIDWQRAEIDPGGNWPVPSNNQEHPNGVMFSAADLNYGDFVNPIAGSTWRGNDLHVMSVEEGIEIEQNFTGNSPYSTPIIGNLDADAHLEVVSSSFNVNKTEMYVRIWELTGQDAPDITETENELCRVEWSQLGNGPRHTGLYAQPYHGTLPNGWTYMRDRSIVTSTVWCGYAAIPPTEAHLVITDNSVVEFNDGASIRFLSSESGDWLTVGNNVVLKPNSAQDDWWFIQGYLFPWANVRIDRGEIIVESGGSASFTNCTFDGASGLYAVTAESATLTFTNCTFRGYQSAISLDNCEAAISNCTFEDITGHSISISNCLTSGVTIEDCRFDGSGGAAVFAYNSLVTMTGNTITNAEGGALGSAVYAYNSYFTLRGNDISGNKCVGLSAVGGGIAYLTTWTYGDSLRNRISNNLTAFHIPKCDSTWAEMIDVYPSYIYYDGGHNDFIIPTATN